MMALPRPVIDSKVFQSFAADLGPNRLPILLADYQQEIMVRIGRLTELAQAGLAQQAEREAHTLKGVAATIGCLDLADAAFQAEQAARGGKPDTLAVALPGLIDAGEAACRALAGQIALGPGPSFQVSDMGPGAIEILDRSTLGAGFFRLDRLLMRFKRYDGGWSPEVTRDVLIAPSAVMVLPFDPDTGQVLLVEQVRKGPIITGENPWLVEGIAGRVETGEEDEAVARREALEEAGLTLGPLVRIMAAYVSPGTSSEKITLFAAPVSLAQAGGHHGLAGEHEDIKVILTSLTDALAAVGDGRIGSYPTAAGMLWIAAHRERLAALHRTAPKG